MDTEFEDNQLFGRRECSCIPATLTTSDLFSYPKLIIVILLCIDILQEKPHKCSLCAKSFPTPGDLKSHMYVHSGSWPFKCHICSRGFSKHTNLKNHLFLHTGKCDILIKPLLRLKLNSSSCPPKYRPNQHTFVFNAILLLLLVALRPNAAMMMISCGRTIIIIITGNSSPHPVVVDRSGTVLSFVVHQL